MNSFRLTAKDLKLGFKGRVIVYLEELCIEEGTIHVIAGPNGAGKSTLLKALARQMSPLAGSICLNGKNIWQMNEREFAQRVSYVPQSRETAKHLSVRDLVSLGRNPHQMWYQWHANEGDRKAIEEAIESCRLNEFAETLVTELSGGERQRAFIAMALAQEPSLLIMDEPTAHLDFRHQLELLDLVLSLKKQGKSALLVLHDLNLIAQVADCLHLLEKSETKANQDLNAEGRLVFSGSMNQALEDKMISKIFQVDIAILEDPLSGSRGYLTRRQSR